jgi:cytochrome P450
MMNFTSGGLVAPLKLVTREFLRDPYPIFAALREETPAFPIEGNGFRMWVVTRYADVRRLLKDPSVNKDIVGTRKERVKRSMVRMDRRAKLAVESRRSLLDRDGIDHRRLRGVMQHIFHPRNVALLRPRVSDLAASIASMLPEHGVVDVHSQFALPIAQTIISELTGVSEKYRGLFPPLISRILTGDSPEEVEEAGSQMHQLAFDLIAHCREHPSENLFSVLLKAREDGMMDEDELASTIIVVLMAGLEPATAICNGLLLLLQHPYQKEQLLANPVMLSSCVEEVLRFESPFRMLPPRFCDRPIEMEDVTIPAGEMIILCIASANRDPDVVEDGERFDITRKNKAHLSFGHGAHRCLGAELGRIETGEAIAAFLRRFPDAKLASEPDQIRWRAATFLRRVDSLPLIVG